MSLNQTSIRCIVSYFAEIFQINLQLINRLKHTYLESGNQESWGWNLCILTNQTQVLTLLTSVIKNGLVFIQYFQITDLLFILFLSSKFQTLQLCLFHHSGKMLLNYLLVFTLCLTIQCIYPGQSKPEQKTLNLNISDNMSVIWSKSTHLICQFECNGRSRATVYSTKVEVWLKYETKWSFFHIQWIENIKNER